MSLEDIQYNGEKVFHAKDTPVAFADGKANREVIEELSAALKIDVIFGKPDTSKNGPILRIDETGLTLDGGTMKMRGDFSRMIPRLKASNLKNELLIRASRIKNGDAPKTAIDATAGMGEDALLLAAVGFNVRLYERDALIAALLKDAFRRAQETEELREILKRMTVTEADSLTALKNQTSPPDLIYLDPMFPARQKSALVKKKFQLLHYLEEPCCDEEELLKAAISANPRKIVIKRPSKGPYLAGIKPNYSIEGKGIRYDCIVIR